MAGGVSQPCRLWRLIGVALFLRASIVAAHPSIYHEIERVSEALQKQPDRVDLLNERGVCYRLAGNFEASLADFDKAGRLDPSNLDLAAHRGMTLSAMGRNEEAERELTRYLDGGRVSASVLAERGLVRAKLGKLEPAIQDFNRSLSINPDIELYIERCKVEESLGRLNRAAAGLREGLAALGGAVVLRDRLVDVELRQKNYDGAIRVIDEQIAVTPVRTEWLLRRAEILATAGRAADARRDRMLALDEANNALARRTTANHLVSRAKVFWALGRLDEARKDLQLALDQSPRMDEARGMLAKLDGAANPSTDSPTIEKRGTQ